MKYRRELILNSLVFFLGFFGTFMAFAAYGLLSHPQSFFNAPIIFPVTGILCYAYVFIVGFILRYGEFHNYAFESLWKFERWPLILIMIFAVLIAISTIRVGILPLLTCGIASVALYIARWRLRSLPFIIKYDITRCNLTDEDVESFDLTVTKILKVYPEAFDDFSDLAKKKCREKGIIEK